MIEFLVARDGRWPALAKRHLAANPECVACGRRERCRPHHKVPVHVDRTRELDPANLITLCEGGDGNCHLTFGHCGRWDAYNEDVQADALLYRTRVERARKRLPARLTYRRTWSQWVAQAAGGLYDWLVNR